MKQQTLTDEERLLLVSYRIQRAKETLSEADNLMNAGFYNAVVNRLYYACYYAVTALLIKNNITAQTHHGAKQMFSLHFISTNKIDKRHSVFFSRLLNDRMSGDYDDFVNYDNDMITALRPQAEEFITMIEKELKKV